MADNAGNGRAGRWKAWTGTIIYWLFAGIALLLIVTAFSSYPRDGVGELAQVIAGGSLYLIGRDMRRVLAGAA